MALILQEKQDNEIAPDARYLGRLYRRLGVGGRVDVATGTTPRRRKRTNASIPIRRRG